MNKTKVCNDSSESAVAASLFMEGLEDVTLQLSDESIKPRVWKRYVECDVLVSVIPD